MKIGKISLTTKDNMEVLLDILAKLEEVRCKMIDYEKELDELRALIGEKGFRSITNSGKVYKGSSYADIMAGT